jgi:hypothetical protein
MTVENGPALKGRNPLEVSPLQGLPFPNETQGVALGYFITPLRGCKPPYASSGFTTVPCTSVSR